MSDKQISGFEEFWTTKQRDYVLVGVDGHYSIIQLSTAMIVTIEDDDVSRWVIEKMISMENQQFTISEYKAYRQQSK